MYVCKCFCVYVCLSNKRFCIVVRYLCRRSIHKKLHMWPLPAYLVSSFKSKAQLTIYTLDHLILMLCGIPRDVTSGASLGNKDYNMRELLKGVFQWLKRQAQLNMEQLLQ